ncbi:uncharacterized protein L3040_008275 [Drepanopeziza brunnea f. sp. 'multigermtubi']|uniref:N-acetyltransferase domain-containing protein n=1 Tax=Marssonina brunnea f. sp. multigermtubi (strain MB_m1) TaxID=1072389 RepID=K1X0G5_MARBU|nr:uncharacterized protein MBM_07598 [Drepanopeziza brunnea f. sp. 'multigermtubi' MB_m1]EKD14368.1 hypothetical protein MBM_07598 [Drepanopeziza brunnea f. sp. 'multigermtubi' MB_m1]KAJ5035013.1 hypothetical protein L3040_008275 [Drepanopeziza brunnea f. sp. 'multigermtubi']
MSTHEPKGDPVTGPSSLLPDPSLTLKGRHSICLVPLSPSHTEGLYASLGGPENDGLYTYMPNEPIHSLDAMAKLVETLIGSPVFFPYAVLSTAKYTAVGIICYMNMVPEHRCIEIGHVLFGAMLQRTPASTECNFLLMRYAFEELGYRRVEWKANDFNELSKRAALRLGFTAEGVFRKHLVVKGKRRDTAWFSCIDDEWQAGVGKALSEWLGKSNFDAEGKQVKRLEEFRQKGECV